ncbi:MAG TPA: cytochrome c oxidase assembly protein, partial [Acidimicrobiales bacterium]|nr:cytochrome c oxidase assembly protein [Acidimicrobiales bacterium]
MGLPPFWQITPVGVASVAVGISHEVGLRRLSTRQTPQHRGRTRRRSLVFYAGLIGLVVVVSGPLDRWSVKWLSVHMVTHVVEMFYLPPLLIAGGAWAPLAFALPLSLRRRVLRGYYLATSTGWLRGLGSLLTNPVFAIVAFNGVMVLWHIPVVYNWASWHDWALSWLMVPSFVLSGILFWRVILPSYPFPPRGSTLVQIVAIVVTGFEMLMLAMALSIFSKRPWYSRNISIDGPAAAL